MHVCSSSNSIFYLILRFKHKQFCKATKSDPVSQFYGDSSNLYGNIKCMIILDFFLNLSFSSNEIFLYENVEYYTDFITKKSYYPYEE